MPTFIPKKLNENITNTNFYYGILVCAIGTIFYCYEFILRIIPGVLQNELSAAFGNISASVFGQISAFYYFAYAPMQIPVGILMDRFGPKLLLAFACLCCTVGSVLFMNFASINIASFGRFIVGFGSSFAFVGVLTLSVHWLPPRYFSLVAGLVTTLGMLGVVFGEIKLTKLSVQFGLFYTLNWMVIVGAILTLIILVVVRNGPHGFILKSEPWSKFFKNIWIVFTLPQVWVIGCVGALLYTSLSVFGELWGKTYLEQVHHLSKVQAAQSISVLFLGWAFGAPLSGYISDITSQRILPIVLGAFGALVVISIVLFSHSLSFEVINILMFLYGLFSSTEIVVFAMAKEATKVNLSGTVFAVINMIIMLGGVIFQPLVGKLLDVFDHVPEGATIPIYTMQDFQLALSVLPLSLLMVMILAFFLKDYQKY